MKKNEIIQFKSIQRKIFTMRGLQVMLDSDLAELYGVETKVFNQAVKRNTERFPKKFRFQLTEEEFENLRSQFVTSSDEQNLRFQNSTSSSIHGGRRYLPYVFTEQGVAMLSAVLKSDTAVKVSIQIINAFVEMRRFITSNADVFKRIETVERKQLEHKVEADQKFDQIFNAIEEREIIPKQGIFFDGQIFDAYQFVSDLIRTAKKSILIIDNYIDDIVLVHLTKRKKNVNALLLTKSISKQLLLDVKKFNEQYPIIKIKEFKNSHDRFLIIDNKTIYHFGASLKDLGKKWFAFTKMNINAAKMLSKLKKVKTDG